MSVIKRWWTANIPYNWHNSAFKKRFWLLVCWGLPSTGIVTITVGTVLLLGIHTPIPVASAITYGVFYALLCFLCGCTGTLVWVDEYEYKQSKIVKKDEK